MIIKIKPTKPVIWGNCLRYRTALSLKFHARNIFSGIVGSLRREKLR